MSQSDQGGRIADEMQELAEEAAANGRCEFIFRGDRYCADCQAWLGAMCDPFSGKDHECGP